MYYFTPDTIVQAYKNLEALDAKAGGLFCILSSLTENIEENASYTIDGEKLRRQLSLVFDKTPKDSFDNVKPSYIIFAKDWSTTFFKKYIKKRIDLFSCAIFFLRRYGFERQCTKEEVVETFIKRYNLNKLKNDWFIDGKNLTLEYNQSAVEDNQTDFYLKMDYINDFKSLLFNGVIQKSAADLKAAGQIQTLYSGSGVQTCFLLSDEPLNQYYIMQNATKAGNNQLAGSNSVDNETKFKEWLSNVKKTNGETYSISTINQYMSAVKSVPNDFADAISPYATIFNISDTNSFAIVRDAIESADNYAQVNATRGNGALSACLELYCSFLKAKESEKDDNIFTPEWFAEKAANYPELDSEANDLATEFLNRFSIEYLSSLSGIDLLNNIFLNSQNADNLCRVLEFNAKNREIFGSISGGTAYKYGLFFSPNQKTWMTGSSRKPQSLTEDEAIALGSEIRDRLVAGAKAIQEFGELNTIGDYKELYETLSSVTKGDIDKVWFMKYYQMLYPKYFATNYSDFAQRTILDAIGLDKEKYAFVRMGQLRFFADKCGISNVMLNKIFWQYYTESEIIEDKPETTQDISFHTGYETKFARNRILFGAPGTGKSFTINNEKNELLANGGEYERITFHPDYSYANFVGTYKPVPFIDNEGKDAITYSYVPGPFMRTYVKALKNSRTPNAKPFLLIIEEINRANVAAVFGDVFQLLDRDDEEKSEYPIQATEDIKKYLADELGGVPVDYAEIRIPDNMFIWATMNSADQGVFPMDTAFKRRWDFTYLGIDDSEEGVVGKVVTLGKGNYERTVEWNELRKAINEELLTYKVNEDKLMGPYFISKKVMPEGTQIDAETFIRVFKNKVIMYLFDDAAKQKRHSLFAGCDEKTRTQYSKICDEFEKRGVAIFCNAIKDRFIPEEQGDE